jgi:hypothetical protein
MIGKKLIEQLAIAPRDLNLGHVDPGDYVIHLIVSWIGVITSGCDKRSDGWRCLLAMENFRSGETATVPA